MLKYQISILMVFKVFSQYCINILLNIFFFILTSYLGNDILGNVYVPSKYSQNTFTPVCCHVCSDNQFYRTPELIADEMVESDFSMARIGQHFWRINSRRTRCSLFNLSNKSHSSFKHHYKFTSTIVQIWAHLKQYWCCCELFKMDCFWKLLQYSHTIPP